MAVVNTNIIKQPLKILEIPLSKFTDEVIPHHQAIFDRHKVACQKLIQLNNADQLSKEVKDKKRTIKQLKDLMYELDTLRTQVKDEDLDKFDTKTLSLRKIILTLISGYTDFEKILYQLINTQLEIEESNAENKNPFMGASQIQIEGSLDELKLQGQQHTLNRVEAIHEDVKDLHEMYVNLNGMVEEQKVHVDQVEESVESTNTNVKSGLLQLIKANKYKTGACTLTGAVIGSVVGGPIGLLVGGKIGGLAVLGCTLAGYTGGKVLKKMNENDIKESEDANSQNAANIENVSENINQETEKKNI